MYSVYSALGINMGLLFEMYVLSRLMSYVCSRRSKGQFVDVIFDENIYHKVFINDNKGLIFKLKFLGLV